jgi:DNA-binding CsgD family transcriptional regulator
MAGPRGFDPIAIVECSYALQGSESEWIDRLLEAVAPAIDQGIGVYGYTYRSNGERPVITAVASGNPAWERVLLEMRDKIPSDHVAATIGVRRPTIATESQQVAKLPPHRRNANESIYRALGFADVLAIHATEPNGGLVLASMLPEKQTVPARETARWQRITAHMSSALRLRRHIEREAVEDEAVLSPSGNLLHATGVAKQADARERLRDAARAMDRARGPLRRNDPQEALELWRALCAGRWSLVDRFESDGRRFLIAHRNQPHLPDLRGLSQREASVAAFAQLGQSNKEIAYTLGLSPSSVATHLSAALRKLGLPSRAALVTTSFGLQVDKPGDQL